MADKFPPRPDVRNVQFGARRAPSHSGGLGKAKILEPDDLDKALRLAFDKSDYGQRDRLYILLSHYCGLRAKEIATLWVEDIRNVKGEIGEVINVAKRSAKYGKARTIPMHPTVREALISYVTAAAIDKGPIFWSYLGKPVTANAVQKQIATIYARCDFHGARSHSGRRSFITTLARKANTVNASLRDVQLLAGHADLTTTATYIDPSPNASELVSLL